MSQREPVELDEILIELGQFGRFQVLTYMLISLPVIYAGVSIVTYVFTAGDLHYRCRIPECDDNGTVFRPDWLEYAVPMEQRSGKDEPSHCLRYNVNNSAGTCDADNFLKTTTRCDDWVYDGDDSTILREWNLTCEDNQWQLTLVGTVNSLGQFVGLPLVGFFSDRFGRKSALVGCLVLTAVIGAARAFSPNYIVFVVLEFVNMMVGGSVLFGAAFVIAMELVGPEKRVLGGVIINGLDAVGEVLMGLIAWWVQDWKVLLWACYGPGIIFLSYYWFLPESVRWLMAKGRMKEAEEIILRAAKVNKVQLSDRVLSRFRDQSSALTESEMKAEGEEKGKNKSVIRQVMDSRILLLRLLNCCFCWMTNTFVYFGLSLNSVAVGSNKYTSFILVCLIELPGYTLTYFVLGSRLGRKSSLCASLLLSGACCIAFMFVPKDLEWLGMVLFLFGKFSITIAFTTIYMYTAELFPTSLRHSLLGVCSMFGRLGSVVAPQTPLLVEKSAMDLDELLVELGQFGRYQIIIYLYLSVPVIFSSIFVITYVFTAGEVHYRCRIPECDEPAAKYYPIPEWISYSSGWEEFEGERVPRRCDRYEPASSNYTWREPKMRALDESTCPAKLFSRKLIPCKDFIFDDDEITIANEWGIVCDDTWMLSFVGTINNVGQFAGLPFAGLFSDRMGRKTTLVLSTIASGIFGLVRSFSGDYIFFVVMEFLEPVFGVGMYTSAFVLCMELVGPEKRVLGGMIVSLFYALGEASLGAVAWAVKDWRMLLWVTYAPALLLFVYYWLMPESVRWLMARGRTEDARRVLLKVAKQNKTTLSETLLHDFLYGRREPGQSNASQSSSSPDAEGTIAGAESTFVPLKGSLMEALRSKILVLRLLNCSYCWMANTFVYYGLSLFSVAIGGNKYLNFILVSLIELPAYVLMYFLTDRLGRRTTLAASLALSGISCGTFVFIPQEADEWLHMLPYMLGKFSITIAFSVLFIYSAELFPTTLRHSLLSVCSMFGRLGSIMAPQTPLLAKYVESLPIIMFCILSISSGVLTLLLPETVNVKLPDTVMEAEKLGERKNQRTVIT
ncbi:solute carrier family 22 member 2 [Anabrus simplex]|uniref:solute carrier family 22 member 2 n=1 Tax=Anabrus simplex TaxID=316456 RepID=UPI0035A383FC